MLGATFIHELERDRLAKISVNDLDDFLLVQMDVLATLDFQLMASEAGLTWSEGEPVFYDPEDGLAIFKVSSEGIRFALGRADDLDEDQRADLSRLKNFTERYGTETIYEFATF
jgi:hypothetical protein